MLRVVSLLAACLMLLASTPSDAFVPSTKSTTSLFHSSPFIKATSKTTTTTTTTPSDSSVRKYSNLLLRMSVVDIDSEEAFDNTVQSAAGALVVVDYSTTWCGPCKVIAPMFDELSDKYTDAVFLKVIGDASPEASKLMKREGVRSVPSFHYFLNGEKVDVVNGANAEAIEAAITKHIQ